MQKLIDIQLKNRRQQELEAKLASGHVGKLKCRMQGRQILLESIKMIFSAKKVSPVIIDSLPVRVPR